MGVYNRRIAKIVFWASGKIDKAFQSISFSLFYGGWVGASVGGRVGEWGQGGGGGYDTSPRSIHDPCRGAPLPPSPPRRLSLRAHRPTALCLISRRDDQALQLLSGTVWPCGPCLQCNQWDATPFHVQLAQGYGPVVVQFACPARMPRGRGVPDSVPIRL